MTGLHVEAVPVAGRDDDGLRWRTRQRYAVPAGRTAGHAGRTAPTSSSPVDDCLIAADDARPPTPRPVGRRAPVDRTHDVTSADPPFSVAADGFWQVHPGRPASLVATVLDLLDPQPGERALDLYAGVGLFARFVGEATGARVVAVEADRAACRHARRQPGGARGRRSSSAARSTGCSLRRTTSRSTSSSSTRPARAPSASSSSRSSTAGPRAVAYVACDPAALGRDVAIFAEHGYELTAAPGLRPLPDDPPRRVRRAAGAASALSACHARGAAAGGAMATYDVNPAAVAHARKLIDGRQYVLDSDWGQVQPRAEDENALPRAPLVGRLRRLAPRPHRGRQRRDQGPPRVRLRRPQARPPVRPDRLRLPRLRVAAQGRGAGRARPAATARPDGRDRLTGCVSGGRPRGPTARRASCRARSRRPRSTRAAGRGRAAGTAPPAPGRRRRAPR